jgi:hypothetical protein
MPNEMWLNHTVRSRQVLNYELQMTRKKTPGTYLKSMI